MMENHLIEIALLDNRGHTLIKSGARLTLRFLDKVDADLGFELGETNSDLDQVETFYFLREACRESLEKLMGAENYVYLLVDELTLSFDSTIYNNQSALTILASAINGVLILGSFGGHDT